MRWSVFGSPLLLTLLAGTILSLMATLLPHVLPLPVLVDPWAEQAVAGSADSTSNVQAAEIERALERPIFHDNRRPAQEQQAAPQAVQTVLKVEAPFILVGIMGNASRGRSAYLQNKDTDETVNVTEGAQAGNWTVDTIGENFVTLIMGDEREVIQLASGG